MIFRSLLLLLVASEAAWAADVQVSETFGGPHGTAFSDEATAAVGQTVKSITIRAGERVDGLTLTISTPTPQTYSHGGGGGTENTLNLGAGEVITSMEAHWGKKKGRTRIFYLSFGTSAGNSVSSGSMTNEKGTVTAPEGFQLVGFTGQDGDEIDLIGAVWARITPETPPPATEAPAPAATEAPAPASAPTKAPAASADKAAAGSGAPTSSDASTAGSEAPASSDDSATGSQTQLASGSAADTEVQIDAPAASDDVSMAASAMSSDSSTAGSEDPADIGDTTAAGSGASDDSSAGGSRSPVPSASAVVIGTDPAPTEAPAPAATEAPAPTAPPISIEDSVQLSESFGGPHGTQFSDESTARSGQSVASISIFTGERLDGLTMEITAPKPLAFTHGGTGGEAKKLTLGEGEHITSMEVHWGKKDKRTRIFYVNFVTSAGNSLAGGSMTEEKGTVTAPEGFQLGGFFGQDGEEIDNLGVVWTSIEAVTVAPTPAPAAAGSAGAETQTVNMKATLLSEAFGGPHGEGFSDETSALSGQVVTALTVRGDKRVDGVTLDIAKPIAKSFSHGGSGGTPNVLTLGEGEYITSMEAHWGKKDDRTRIFYLSFGTNAGNSVSAGSKTEESVKVTAPEGYQLGGFFGRAGEEIDLLGVVWTSIKAVPVPGSGEDIMLSAMYGGPHGIAFSDIAKVRLGQAFSSVTIRGEERVDQVTLQVSSPEALTWTHGGSGGEDHVLTLGQGELINSMEVHWGKVGGRTRVFYLGFGTSAGNSVGVGSKTGDNILLTAPEGYKLGGLFGRAESEVDQIGAIWTKIDAKHMELTDEVGSDWYGSTIRNWVGPTIGNAKDTACYRKMQNQNSDGVCPLGYSTDGGSCITQCPFSYPVECYAECIPQNDDCAQAIMQKVASVAGVVFNAATGGVFKTIWNTYKTAKRVYMCAATVISVLKSFIYYMRFKQTTAPQGDVEQMLAVAYKTDVIIVDLPVAVATCLGMPVPKKLQATGIVLMIVENIVKQAIVNGEQIVSSAENVIKLLTDTKAIDTPDSTVTELQDFIDSNSSCGYELKRLADHVIYSVSDIRNKTPNAAIDDIRVTVSESSLVLNEIPAVTNNCMKEMLPTKTPTAAFETRDLLRKTFGVIIDQLIEKSTTDMGVNVAEEDYLLEVSNLGLTAIGGLDPTGIVWMASQFVQPICGPTAFIGEIDDGTLYDALGLTTIDDAFEGSYGWWTKKGDGVVSLIFESTDTQDVTVVVHCGGDDFAEVDVAAGETVTWDSTVKELQDKTFYLDRWRPGVGGLPGSGGGSLVMWIPRSDDGGHISMHVRINAS